MRQTVYRRVIQKIECEIQMDYEGAKDVYFVVADGNDHSKHDSIWEAKKVVDELIEKAR